MSFLTLEDINTTLYSNQGFYWHEIDTSVIDPDGTAEYENRKVDFCTITKKPDSRYGMYKYTVTVNATNFTGGFNFLSKNGEAINGDVSRDENVFMGVYAKSKAPLKILLYMGVGEISSGYGLMPYYIVNPTLDLNLKELNQSKTITIKSWGPEYANSVSQILAKGYNEIYYYSISCGFLLVNLIKTDFQFNCNQELINGKINTVQLGTDTDYLPNGDLIGEYTPHITLLYGDETLPVTWNSQLNDYTFDIDLTNHEKETDIPLTVYIDSNEVINQTETNIRLHTRFETIDTLSKVNALFTNGGVGRLGANITLNTDLTVTNDVYLIGNDHTINLDGHKIIIPTDHTFKADNTHFRYGENTIQQNTGSKVELTDCTFGYCTGLGSVIDCQVNLDSLSDELDFTTNLTRCIIAESDMAILHGGELNITDCRVQGIISNPSYPYFLYQTDGNATILQSEFTLINNTQISSDIEFNSCIFICGETAQINGYSHTELQNNNLQQFLETQRNSSIINVTYYYTPINDYITLYSEKGYCHSVSSVDYVFKTNVTPTRSD